MVAMPVDILQMPEVKNLSSGRRQAVLCKKSSGFVAARTFFRDAWLVRIRSPAPAIWPKLYAWKNPDPERSIRTAQQSNASNNHIPKNENLHMAAIDDLFRKAQQLPTIPKVAQELIATFNQPDVNIDEIAEKVVLDQAISAKVLRLANTAAYGGSRKISSIREAVMVLGFNSLRTLVLACSFVDAFRMPKGFDIKAFWQNSFRVAAISKWLAPFAKVEGRRLDGEVAFTCGLLHEIGDLLIMAEHPTQFTNIDNSAKLGANRAELEQTLLGFDYCEVGAELANRWHFPSTIVDSIRYHSATHTAPAFAPYAAIIALALQVGAQINAEVTHDQLMDALPSDLLQQLGIDTRKMAEQLDGINEATQAIAAFL
jgi:HD-like signal output (HDOD) protein